MEACSSTEPISENVRGLVTKSQYLFLSFKFLSITLWFKKNQTHLVLHLLLCEFNLLSQFLYP